MARYREPSKNRGSQFGATEGFRNGGKHGGADWTTWNGRAITSGTVTAVYWSDVIGNVVIQTTQDDKFLLYAHLAQPSKLKVGTKVVIGLTKIGNMGSTGTASTGPHVHIAMSKKSNPSLAAFADLIDPVKHIKEQNAKR
jgi:murein DD-endopeptidase MepM/ murein hydrolase activator NlpD